MIVSSALKRVYTFEDGSFIENIAVRSNGHLVLTSLSHPRVYTIDPTSANPTPRIIAEFNSTVANGVTGVTEYAPDRFAFIAGQFSTANFSAEATALWSIDLRGYSSSQQPQKIADLNNIFGNGLTTLPKTPGTVLFSDSILGALWSVNTQTGALRKVAQNEAFAPSNPTGPFPLGINGIRTHGSDLYFVNSNQQRFAKVRIHADGTLAGNVTDLAAPRLDQGEVAFDDFTVDRAGRSWVAALFDTLDVILPDGELVVAASGLNPNPLPHTAGPTSAAFGRGSKKQEQTLYITSAFGIVFALDTTKVVLK
ncbi:hypothetical protein BKA62DRAFT_322852 [Auriculariales sp. MPI-PUGE-AT-0066]|nr:hypothetical protein BKA62DRAFT_322852 [Auriculariales sp. MPI-PUGE-AT-0066]